MHDEILNARQPIISAESVSRSFGGGRRLLGGERPKVHAVQDLSFELHPGETLGIVGESGCGKSTLARLLVGLDSPSAGRLLFSGKPVTTNARRRELASSVQYVFQDPVASLNPRKRVHQVLDAPMRLLAGLDRPARQRRARELLDAVNLEADFLQRYPHELSGGQAQRIGIARALAAQPKVIVLDEPVSALDVSIQAQVLNLLAELKQQFDLTYVFISHDLSVVEGVSSRTAVMYFGRIVEQGSRQQVFEQPRHPYTRLLLDSAPVPGRRSVKPEQGVGELPDPYKPPPGCAFAARCPRAQEQCRSAIPELSTEENMPGHQVACFCPLDTVSADLL